MQQIEIKVVLGVQVNKVCNQKRQCENCGHYSYDSFHNEEYCNCKDVLVRHPYGYQEDGVDCDHWICLYEFMCQEQSKMLEDLRKRLKDLDELYQAEKVLRKAAESK